VDEGAHQCLGRHTGGHYSLDNLDEGEKDHDNPEGSGGVIGKLSRLVENNTKGFLEGGGGKPWARSGSSSDGRREDLR